MRISKVRPGAFCVYIYSWDIEIFDFLDLKKKNGEDRRRAHNLNTAINFDDVFMERLENDEEYTLFSPSDVPLLLETYGEEYKKHYINYENMFKKDPTKFNKYTKTIKANDIMKEYAISIYNEGMPFTHYIDTVNKAHKFPQLGKIRSSNLCTEIEQPTDEHRTAVCNLGSINLAKVNTEEDLRRVTRIAVRMLDNYVDLTTYTNPKSKLAQQERRAIGLGCLGEAELIAQKGIMYGSDEHIKYIENIYRIISETAEETTKELAKEKGSCIIKGRRNAYLMAVAPNTTSGIKACTTNSHECVFSRIWTEDNKLGLTTFTAPNITPENYPYYVNSYEVDQKRLIDVTAVRSKYIDQGISHAVFLNPEDLKASYIKELFIYAWKKGLKTLYYFRSQPPSNNGIEIKKDNGIQCVGCHN